MQRSALIALIASLNKTCSPKKSLNVSKEHFQRFFSKYEILYRLSAKILKKLSGKFLAGVLKSAFYV